MESKNDIRNRIRSVREKMTEKRRAEKSKVIQSKLENTEVFKKARSVLFYFNTGSEVQTKALIQKYWNQKKLFLPKLQSKQKTFSAAPIQNLSKLEKNAFGIPEPQEAAVEMDEIPLDIIIVPGVAFDKSGGRIGMGMGYYDRFLMQYPQTFKMALAFEEQMVEKVAQEPYDVPVNGVITDQDLYLF